MISILQGNAVDIMQNDLPMRSIDMIFTSPNPVYHLQGENVNDKRVLGTEIKAMDYLNNLVNTLTTAGKTVLKPQGSLWVHMGDYYEKRTLRLIPERFARQMQRKGWCVRGKIIWHRTENIAPKRDDRLKNDVEYVYWFIRNPMDYFFNSNSRFKATSLIQAPMKLKQDGFESGFPHKLIEAAIDMTCPKEGTVLDMYAGTGETAVVAKKMGRTSIMIDIDERMYYGMRGRFNIEKINFGLQEPIRNADTI